MIAGATKRTIVGDGVELAVLEAGRPELPTLVLVHGYPDTKEVWGEVIEELGPGFHTVAYDVRGAGGSSAPRWPKSYDLERLADDFAAVIAATSPGSPVHLIGHDWGAIAGWEFATLARFDGRLASFTAIAGPSLDQLALSGRQLLRRPAPGATVKALAGMSRSWYVLGLLTPGYPTLMWRVLAPGRWRWMLQNVEHLPASGEHPAPTLARDGINGAKLYRRNIPRRMLRPRRDAVARVPVQLILPSHDRFITPRYYDDAERYAPQLRRRVIGGSHWAPRKHPSVIARWIEEFVGELGRPALPA